MKLLPRSMIARITVTLAIAAAAVVVLDMAVKSADAAKPPKRPVYIAPALPPPVRLTPVSGTVVLATSMAAVPMTAAPVVQVFDDGGYVLHRPAPVSTGPEIAAAGPAIVIPTGFRRLDSRARATFVEVVGALIAERPVSLARFRTLGFEVESSELLRVLAWVR